MNHKRQILENVAGYPAHWNDNTIFLHDELVRRLKNGSMLSKHFFELCERLCNGKIISVKCRGS